MPIIDVYARIGTFADKHQLAVDLAKTLMTLEGVRAIPMFRQNTDAFVHELPTDALSNVDGENSYVRVQVLTNAGALDRDKQLAVVEQITAIVALAGGEEGSAQRTWVLLTEATPGGWGLAGHANTNDELVVDARAQIAELSANQRTSCATPCTITSSTDSYRSACGATPLTGRCNLPSQTPAHT